MSAEKWRAFGIEVDDPEGISEQSLFYVGSYLLLLERVERGLAQRAVRYVVDGVDEDVLGEMTARRSECVSALRLGQHFVPVELTAVIRRLGDAPRALHRLGRLIHAIGGVGRVRAGSQVPGWFWAIYDTTRDAGRSRFDAPALGRLLEAGGQEPGLLIEVQIPAADHYPSPLDGMASFLREHEDAVRDRLSRWEPARARAGLLELLGLHQVVLPSLVDLLAREATSGTKVNRTLAMAQLARLGDASRAPLERLAKEGSAPTRRAAYQALDQLYGAAAAPFLASLVEGERSAKNRDVLREICARPAVEAPAPSLPPLAPVPEHVPLPEGYLAHLRAAFGGAGARRAQHWERMRKQGIAYYESNEPPPPPTEEALEELAQRLERGGSGAPGPETWHDDKALGELGRYAGLHPVHVWRLLTEVGRGRGAVPVWAARPILKACRRANEGRPDLRELAHVATFDGASPDAIAVAQLSGSRWGGGLGYRPEEAWTFFSEHPALLEEALEGRDRSLHHNAELWQENAYSVLAAFPELPSKAAEIAWRHALGTAKRPRPWARAALARAEGKTQRIVRALADGKQEVRATAADWLAELGDPAAIEPLKQALRKEKREIPKGAMFKALAALGVDLAPYLDRAALQKEALKKLKNGLPPKLAWFPFDALPTPTWKSDGAPVAIESLQWMIVSAHKLKTPVPSPLLRLYAERWAGAESLGDFMLEQWIARDARLPSREEVEPTVQAQAAQWRSWGHNLDDAAIEAMLRAAMSRPVGSAQADRGILAFATAMGGPSVAAKVERYLKDWFGNRAPQCKTLLELLAHRSDAHSIQVLLATATRFRTKGIREEARQRVAELAERRGWTPAELADRTVPTAGFELDETDRRPVLSLDLGPRVLRVLLDDALAVVLDKGGGKTTKTFPKPRKDDDAELAAAAKKTFAATKKQVKQVVRMQGDRLYEAMCTAQRWDAETWREHLWQHPIVGRLCERVVWVVLRGEEVVGAFRPLGDGTLTDVDDEPVTLPDDVEVAVAHDSWLGVELAARWREHLDDYEVTTLFPQLGAEPLELTDAQRDEVVLDELEGYIVDAFTLRGQLMKDGYTRGEAFDGGWFYTYTRAFPSIGLTATVEFSGSPLPEENRSVALGGVRFHPADDDVEHGAAIPLGDVPPVLLTEVREQVRRVAALGSGRDPDWELRLA